MKTFLNYFLAILFLLLLLAAFAGVLIVAAKLIGTVWVLVAIAIATLVLYFRKMQTKYVLEVYEGGAWYTDGTYDSMTEISDRLDKLGELVEDYAIKTVYVR